MSKKYTCTVEYLVKSKVEVTVEDELAKRYDKGRCKPRDLYLCATEHEIITREDGTPQQDIFDVSVYNVHEVKDSPDNLVELPVKESKIILTD